MSADLELLALKDPRDADTAWHSQNIEVFLDDDEDPGEFLRLQEMGFKVACQTDYDHFCELHIDAWRRGDTIFFCELSTLKASILGEIHKYIPGPALSLIRLLSTFDGPPRITQPFIRAVMVAMNTPNRSIYGRRRYFTVRDDRGGYRIEMGKANRKYGGRGRYRHTGHEQRSSGVQRRRAVKKWLLAHEGMYLVPVGPI